MSAKKETSKSSWLLRIIGGVLGALASIYMGDMIRSAVPQTLYQKTSAGDLISIGIGVLLAIFGQKIHPIVRWFGVGWATYAITSEVASYIVPSGT